MLQHVHFVESADCTRDDLIQIIDLNRRVYGEEFAIPLSQLEAVHRKNGTLAVLAREADRQRVIGYMSDLPLRKSTFDAVMRADFDESFGPADIVSYEVDGQRAHRYHLYLASMVVAPEFRR